MIQTIDMKHKRDGKWQDVPLSDYAGKTLGDFLQTMDGQDFRARVTQDGFVGYLCGTDEVTEQIKAHGMYAVRCSEALAKLRAKGSPLIDCEIPAWVARVFDDATVAEISAGR